VLREPSGIDTERRCLRAPHRYAAVRRSAATRDMGPSHDPSLLVDVLEAAFPNPRGEARAARASKRETTIAEGGHTPRPLSQSLPLEAVTFRGRDDLTPHLRGKVSEQGGLLRRWRRQVAGSLRLLHGATASFPATSRPSCAVLPTASASSSTSTGASCCCRRTGLHAGLPTCATTKSSRAFLASVIRAAPLPGARVVVLRAQGSEAGDVALVRSRRR
jgi:hypothetical protein